MDELLLGVNGEVVDSHFVGSNGKPRCGRFIGVGCARYVSCTPLLRVGNFGRMQL